MSSTQADRFRNVMRDKDGTIINRSRNLAGFLRYLGSTRNYVKSLDVSRVGNQSEGKLSVLFSNGDSFETTFASFLVLCYWILARRNLSGAPLSIDGVQSGVIERSNKALMYAKNIGIGEVQRWRASAAGRGGQTQRFTTVGLGQTDIAGLRQDS